MRRVIGIAIAGLLLAGCVPASNDAGSASADGLFRRTRRSLTQAPSLAPAPNVTSTTTAPPASLTTNTTIPTPSTTAVPTPPGPPLAGTFGNAPWNRPVANMAAHPQSSEYSARMYNYGIQGGYSDPSLRGQFSTYFRAYSQPIYDAREATGTIQVFKAGFGFQGSILNGGSVPWNDSWEPPTGNDAIMFIKDPSTGREWDLWLVQKVNKTSCFTLENILLGFSFSGHNICVGQADLIQDASGHPIDYRTYEGGYPIGGTHIQGMAMVVTADEVASGAIHHALSAIVYNTMFGPQCTPQQRYSAAAGVSCGFYENPANRLEWTSEPQNCGEATQQNSDVGRSKSVPEGMRFAIHMSDADIAHWLDSRGYTGARRSTARIFAVAARDYGFIVTKTSCWDAGFFTDGTFNPATQAKWQLLGIPEEGDKALLQGLFTATNLWAVAASEPLSVGSKTAR